MDFKTEFPDYVAIEKFVRQAHLERSLRLAELIASAVVTALNALKAVADRSLGMFTRQRRRQGTSTSLLPQTTEPVRR